MRNKETIAGFTKTKEARFHHRLHVVLMVEYGIPGSVAASIYGDSVRSVQKWVQDYRERGTDGLREEARPGRPPKLSKTQIEELSIKTGSAPQTYGLTEESWNGKSLSEFISQRYGIALSTRQCQRILKSGKMHQP